MKVNASVFVTRQTKEEVVQEDIKWSSGRLREGDFFQSLFSSWRLFDRRIRLHSSFVLPDWRALNWVDSKSCIYLKCCRPGPNAPLQWMKDCVLLLSPEKGKQRSKILLGLNFYGQDFTPMGGGRTYRNRIFLTAQFDSFLHVSSYIYIFPFAFFFQIALAAILGTR